jgi:UrcA family protein
MNIRPKSTTIALLAGAALFCTGAWAAPPSAPQMVTRTETVTYRPSEAASAEGAVKLYQRLTAAARRVCEDPSRVMGAPGLSDPAYVGCVRKALDDAVRQVGSPMVSMLHLHGGVIPAVASR